MHETRWFQASLLVFGGFSGFKCGFSFDPKVELLAGDLRTAAGFVQLAPGRSWLARRHAACRVGMPGTVSHSQRTRFPSLHDDPLKHGSDSSRRGLEYEKGELSGTGLWWFR